MAAKAKKITSKPLTEKQLLFCDYYLLHYNATKAALQAGYAKSSAGQIGYDLLHKGSVQKLLAKKVFKTASKLEITQEKVMQEIGRISFSDIRKIFNDDGSLKKMSELDDDTAASISGVDTEELFDGMGRDRSQIGYTKKVKLWDKVKGLEMLAKHFKLYEEDSKISFNVEIK